MLNCIKCRKPIKGKYFTFTSLRESPFCEECLNSERCNICSRPLFDGETSEVEGRRVCSQCLAELDQCSICQGPVLGKHVAYDDGTILCGGCFMSARECSMCGSPVVKGSMMEVQDKSLCMKCVASLPVCDHHGGPVSGRAFSLGGERIICDRCLETAPACYCCGRPMKDYRTLGTIRFCRECLDNLKSCSSCDEKIPGPGLEMGQDGFVCLACAEFTGICHVCGKACEEFAGRLGDGRGYCPECAESVVESHIRLEEILLSVVSFMERELGQEADPGDDVEITIVDERKMALLKGSQVPRHTLGRFEWAGEEILGFFPVLPLAAAKGAVAHEYSHFWLHNRLNMVISHQLDEGFARLVAVEFLKDQDEDQWARALERISDCFDEGFSECMKVFIRSGLKGVFHMLEEHSLPMDTTGVEDIP